MPEVVTLICDNPDHGDREGVFVRVELGGRRYRVIVCPEDLAPLERLASWGEPDLSDPEPARKGKGLSDERLKALIQE